MANHPHFGKVRLTLSGRKDGNISWLLSRAVWCLSWEAPPAEIRQFVANAPLDSWESLYKYCQEWMSVE